MNRRGFRPTDSHFAYKFGIDTHAPPRCKSMEDIPADRLGSELGDASLGCDVIARVVNIDGLESLRAQFFKHEGQRSRINSVASIIGVRKTPVDERPSFGDRNSAIAARTPLIELSPTEKSHFPAESSGEADLPFGEVLPKIFGVMRLNIILMGRSHYFSHRVGCCRIRDLKVRRRDNGSGVQIESIHNEPFVRKVETKSANELVDYLSDTFLAVHAATGRRMAAHWRGKYFLIRRNLHGIERSKHRRLR